MSFQHWPDRDDLAPFLALGRELGFTAFELDHTLGEAAVAALAPGAARIASVHHPCPRPAGFRAGDAFTAADPAARERAAAALAASLRTAARLGAGAVVLHLGRLEEGPGAELDRLAFELESRCRAGQRGRPRYEAVRRALAAAVAAGEPAALARAAATLEAPLAQARTLGIVLAVETGYLPDELPTPGGMAWLLGALGGGGLAAWLDTGHVAAQAHRGLADFGDWFAAVAGRWAGAHYHDAVGLRDHLVPGDGTLDFGAIARNLPAAALATLEVDWYHAPEELAAGAARLRAELANRAGGGPGA